jgi:hypothetical protein
MTDNPVKIALDDVKLMVLFRDPVRQPMGSLAWVADLGLPIQRRPRT